MRVDLPRTPIASFTCPCRRRMIQSAQPHPRNRAHLIQTMRRPSHQILSTIYLPISRQKVYGPSRATHTNRTRSFGQITVR